MIEEQADLCLKKLLGNQRYKRVLKFFQGQEEIWSSELKATNISLIDKLENFPLAELKILIKRFPYHGKQKGKYYHLLRLMQIRLSSFWLKLLLEEFFGKSQLNNTIEVEYYYMLNDRLYLETLLEKETSWYQNSLRSILSTDEKEYSFFGYLEKVFLIKIEKNNKKEKKTVRHKGYRDHGSLGSEFSRVSKEELQKDCWFKEKLEKLQLEDELSYLQRYYTFLTKEEI